MGRACAVVAAALACAALAPAAAMAAPRQVTVDLIRLIQVENPDPTSGDGDYFAKVRIGGVEQSNRADALDFSTSAVDSSPYWRFTRTVDDSEPLVAVEIEVWDVDCCDVPEFSAPPDDRMDLDDDNADEVLSVTYDLRTGTWSGDTTRGFIRGDGDHAPGTGGGEAAKLLFDITTSDDGDIDDDGIPDGVERFGVLDADGAVDADLRAMGADPCRKTIAVEIDFMSGAADGHTHRPMADAIADVRAAFDAAPVAAVADCPYPGFPRRATGIDLVTDIDDALPEMTAITCGADGNTTNRMDVERRPYFIGSFWIHQYRSGGSPSGSSGLAPCGEGFAVSLGTFDEQVGTRVVQAGTYMHELGHMIGLPHGGAIFGMAGNVNDKPNYVSVMNYAYQFGIPTFDAAGNRTLAVDFSDRATPTLIETRLSESADVGHGNDVGIIWWGPGAAILEQRGPSISWDGSSGGPDLVNVDVNADGQCVAAGMNGRLDTTAADDDVVNGTVIRTGPDHACDTTTPMVDDARPIYAPDFGCIDQGPDGTLNSTPAGDDTVRSEPAPANWTWVAMGPNLVCESTASGDDSQFVPVGQTEPGPLPGANDWPALRFRAQLSPTRSGAEPEPVHELTYAEAAERDMTPPVVTASEDRTAEATGPDGATVTYDPATAEDNLDGSVRAPCDPPSGSTFSLGTTTVTCTARDAGGNQGSDSFTVRVRDTTAPTLRDVPSGVEAAATSGDGAVVLYPTPTATDVVDRSPAVVCVPASGSTFAPGSTTVTCTARDVSGNEATDSFTVRVTYAFSGFFRPIDNTDSAGNQILNVATAGSSVPVRFSLGGHMGMDIFPAGSPRSRPITCDARAPLDPIEETATPGLSELTYNSLSQRYQYGWKTLASWANTCRRLEVVLDDGTTHIAEFRFRR